MIWLTNGNIPLTEQLLNKSDLAYRSFVDTCRSPATRTSYVKALRYFMSYLRIPPDRYDSNEYCRLYQIRKEKPFFCNRLRLLGSDPKILLNERRNFELAQTPLI